MTTSIQVDYELERLGQLCLPRWYDRIDSRIIRPERPEFAMICRNQSHNQRWLRALDRLRRAINTYDPTGQRRKRAKNRLADTPISPMDAFLEDLDAFDFPDDKAKPILSAIALILYDIECSGSPIPYTVNFKRLPGLPRLETWETCDSVFRSFLQHLLLREYGFGNRPVEGMSWKKGLYAVTAVSRHLTAFAQWCRMGRLPPLNAWEHLASILLRGCGSERMPEVALSLYYYETNHRPINHREYQSSRTGYRGVVQKMIDKMPTTGPDRLVRKLSVDLHILIPWCYHHRTRMINVIEDFARTQCLPIRAPVLKNVEIPEIDMTHRDGYPKSVKGGWTIGKYYIPGLPIFIWRLGSRIDERYYYGRGLVEYSDAEHERRLAAAKKAAQQLPCGAYRSSEVHENT
ncbi:hypothetical protein QBC47DRAFT_465128 [Echria macrotheca]|uniref:Uncharacterized protein n=1 Tax=Echria macrotheca TaxID=438768 RepID=A0AAJ0B1T3_9PEZI|nr:hypothetical protein QBC47DRAFT_465128 [Echria macrotheca]